MTAIMLTRIDIQRNMARFYGLDIQPTLFSERSLVRECGGIGRPGTVRVETLRARGTADVAYCQVVGEASKCYR